MSDYKAYIANIEEFKPDSENANQHTLRGRSLVHKGMQKRGYARPAFAAKDGTVLGGNLSTLDVAVDIGLGDGRVLVVETSGNLPIIHKRVDVEPGTEEARLLALEDNRTGELSLDWDAGILIGFMEQDLDLSNLWNPNELSELLEGAADSLLGDRRVDDPLGEWRGMPEFENEEALGAIASVKVHLGSEEDLAKFAQVMGQNVNKNTKFIWFPKKTPENLKQYVASDES